MYSTRCLVRILHKWQYFHFRTYVLVIRWPIIYSKWSSSISFYECLSLTYQALPEYIWGLLPQCTFRRAVMLAHVCIKHLLLLLSVLSESYSIYYRLTYTRSQFDTSTSFTTTQWLSFWPKRRLFLLILERIHHEQHVHFNYSYNLPNSNNVT